MAQVELGVNTWDISTNLIIIEQSNFGILCLPFLNDSNKGFHFVIIAGQLWTCILHKTRFELMKTGRRFICFSLHDYCRCVRVRVNSSALCKERFARSVCHERITQGPWDIRICGLAENAPSDMCTVSRLPEGEPELIRNRRNYDLACHERIGPTHSSTFKGYYQNV